MTDKVTRMTTTQRLRSACSRVAKQINEFGQVVDGEAIDDLDAALCVAYREGAVGDVHPFMVTMLRQIAQQRARASQMMAEDKTARNRAAGEPDALYLGGAPEDMLEWKAADEIRRLRDRVAEMEPVVTAACRVVAADTYKHPILSREEAVAAGVAELHDAVGKYKSAQPASEVSRAER